MRIAEPAECRDQRSGHFSPARRSFNDEPVDGALEDRYDRTRGRSVDFGSCFQDELRVISHQSPAQVRGCGVVRNQVGRLLLLSPASPSALERVAKPEKEHQRQGQDGSDRRPVELAVPDEGEPLNQADPDERPENCASHSESIPGWTIWRNSTKLKAT